MCKQISVIGLEPRDIPVFIESLSHEEREILLMGDIQFFDDPLSKILSDLKGEERMNFIRELLKPLEIDEKKILFESSAFDCLFDNEFEELRMLIVL